MSNGGSRPPFTFAVIGRDEAPTLAGVLAEAQQAAGRHDRVWYVDSDSSDRSITIAHELGVEVVRAPAGKGQAMSAACERCERGYVVFVDADLLEWSVNIPATLREAALESRAAMVVGSFRDDRRLVTTGSIYWPFVDSLIPDLARAAGPTPLSGQRAVDVSHLNGPLPAGYGAETHLNLSFAATRVPIESADLGFLRGPLRGYANVPDIARDVTRAILDFAVAVRRLDPELRPRWQGWADDVIASIVSQPAPGAPDDEFLRELAALAARPLPPACATVPTG